MGEALAFLGAGASLLALGVQPEQDREAVHNDSCHGRPWLGEDQPAASCKEAPRCKRREDSSHDCPLLERPVKDGSPSGLVGLEHGYCARRLILERS